MYYIDFKMLYIPCMIAMAKRLDRSCYKIMLYMGILDFLVGSFLFAN